MLERDLLFKDLKAAKDIAELSVQVKNQFLACMSHELRTPLHGVLGMIDLLNETEVTCEQEEFIGYLKKSGQVFFPCIRIFTLRV